MTTRTRKWLLVLAGGLVSPAWAACTVVNESHCGNHSGHATCRERSEALPYCDRCVASNDGCVAQPPSEPECRPSEEDLSTSSSGASTGPQDTTGSSGASTGAQSTTGSSGASTGSEGTADAGATGRGDDTDGHDSTGPGDDGETQTETGEPVCGNGKVEGDEACDMDDFDGQTCATVMEDPHYRGALACSGTCELVTVDCCLGPGAPCVVALNDCCGQCVNDGLDTVCNAG